MKKDYKKKKKNINQKKLTWNYYICEADRRIELKRNWDLEITELNHVASVSLVGRGRDKGAKRKPKYEDLKLSLEKREAALASWRFGALKGCFPKPWNIYILNQKVGRQKLGVGVGFGFGFYGGIKAIKIGFKVKIGLGMIFFLLVF